MCCQNGIPYGTGPSQEPVETLKMDIQKGNYTPTKTSASEISRAKDVIDFFKNNGMPSEFGIAIAGVWSAESGIKSWNYNTAEQTNGYAFKNKHAPNAKKFTYNGTQYYMDQANMMKFGYGKGLAQWSWSRVLKFRDWYNSSSGIKTGGLSKMDEWGANITATSVNTQTAFAWKEMQERTGEFMTVVNTIKSNPASSKEEFESNIIMAVDAVLRGYENGGIKKMASKEFMNNYKWDGGYEGAMKKRVERALGIYEQVKNDYGLSFS